jgi:hypothetical protein
MTARLQLSCLVVCGHTHQLIQTFADAATLVFVLIALRQQEGTPVPRISHGVGLLILETTMECRFDFD